MDPVFNLKYADSFTTADQWLNFIWEINVSILLIKIQFFNSLFSFFRISKMNVIKKKCEICLVFVKRGLFGFYFKVQKIRPKSVI